MLDGKSQEIWKVKKLGHLTYRWQLKFMKRELRERLKKTMSTD